VTAEWTRLGTPAAPEHAFGPELVSDLPEPARRWLLHAVPVGTPLWSSVQLTMRGQIKLGRWRSFTARQVLSPSGFIWAATARVTGLPVTGFDRYTSGSGQLRWRLLRLIPVMTGAGPDVTRSAAGRLAGEATCWLPTAFSAASWGSGPEPDTVVATWLIGDGQEVVQLRLAPDGRPRDVLLQRWGNPDGEPFARYPFGVAVDGERTFSGVTIPSQIRAGWWWGTDRQQSGEFFRAEITDARFA
jgi:hypothetical protein